VPREAFPEKLKHRLSKLSVALPEQALGQLHAYFELLAKWNARINLTSLGLSPLTDEAVDRLFVEPLAALPYVPSEAIAWFDLGSGGGSPGVPLRIVRSQGEMTMIEAKARKTAFLREVLRTLDLAHTSVEHARFEDVAAAREAEGQLVTVRAVRADEALQASAAALLGFEGRLLMFVGTPGAAKLRGFEHLETVQLLKDRPSYLAAYRRVVPRGTSD
jgi:16S rRNA (guanine527-N7)-methyltransferase